MSAELLALLQGDYRVTIVPDGEEALREALKRIPDVLISDVMMPKMDGLTLCAALRERPAFRNMGIVLLSARGELADRVRGRQVGVDTYLPKPFHPSELLATVEGLLRSRMRLVGSFLVEGLLGAGGQGNVYLAQHVKSGATAALKLVNAEGDGTGTKNFLRREQESLARVQHPNVVRIFEQGEHQNHFYLAMEYVPGQTFQTLLRERGPLPLGVVKAVGCAVCDALSAVHAAGIIHRDIKPSNLMLASRTADGDASLRARIRVIDFGAALDRANEPPETLVGSLPYLAPELLRGAPPNPGSDLYALGISLFTLSTGKPPFAPSTTAQLLALIDHAADRAAAQKARPALSTVARHASALEAVIRRAIERDPAARWADAAELKAALEALDVGPEGDESLDVPKSVDSPTREMGH